MDNNLQNIPFMLHHLRRSLNSIELLGALKADEAAELLTADLIGQDLVLIRFPDLQRVAQEVPT